VIGPGKWNVTVFEFGDIAGEFDVTCPGGPDQDDPRKYPNGSRAFTNVAYKLDDGGFELYMYNPRTQAGTLIFRMTCADEKKSALQAQQRQRLGQNPNLNLYSGRDISNHPVNVYFIYPDQIQVSGFFADGKAHSYNFPACVSAQTVEFNTPTFTPTSTFTPTPTATSGARPPQISLTASCTIRGNATYRITNTGGDMLTNGTWVVTANGSRVGSDTFRARAGGVVTITSSGVYGNITFTTSGGGTTQQSVSTVCQYPTATPTRTHTPTPRPPQISLAASCTIRGNATYRITNTGGDMLTNGNWVVTANGSRVGGDTFRVRAGGVVTITSSGVYGNITFTISGEGIPSQSVTTFCQYPTATPTRTPTATPRPAR
jgi:hypothetical protein